MKHSNHGKKGTADIAASADDQASSSSEPASGAVDACLSQRLPLLVAQKRAAVRAKQQAVQRELVQLLRVVAQVLGSYESMDRDMLAFADQDIIGHQAELDQVGSKGDEGGQPIPSQCIELQHQSDFLCDIATVPCELP